MIRKKKECTSEQIKLLREAFHAIIGVQSKKNGKENKRKMISSGGNGK